MDYTNMLFNKYGTALLTAKQVSEVTTRSTHTLTADRRNGTGIPFKRTGDSDNSPVRYSLHEVSKWLNQAEQVL
jgi:phosphosulfolactate phosphohydrolase-like enzyme